MNFTNLIGKQFNDADLSKIDYSVEFEDEEWMREEGIEPWWTVGSRDGSFQMKLSKDKVVQTIWLRPIDGVFTFNDYSTKTARHDIRIMMGTPESSGDHIKSILNDDMISWDRFKRDNHYLHFEYTAGSERLRLITIMVLEIIE